MKALGERGGEGRMYPSLPPPAMVTTVTYRGDVIGGEGRRGENVSIPAPSCHGNHGDV